MQRSREAGITCHKTAIGDEKSIALITHFNHSLQAFALSIGTSHKGRKAGSPNAAAASPIAIKLT
jgi:hypothetical protein